MSNTNWIQIGNVPSSTVEGTMTITNTATEVPMQQQIDKLQKQLDALKKQLDEPQNTKVAPKVAMWKPDSDELIYSIVSDEEILQWGYAGSDLAFIEDTYKKGNQFPTRKLAEHYAKNRAARQRLEMLALAENGMAPYEFRAGEQNFMITGVHAEDNLIMILSTHIDMHGGVQYFPSKEAAQCVLDAMTDDDLILLYGTANRGDKQWT